MKSIRNTTITPIRVPLPQGKVLHLGPRQTGQVADQATDHAALAKLIAAGKIEVVEEGGHGGTTSAGESSANTSTAGKGPNKSMRKAGDR